MAVQQPWDYIAKIIALGDSGSGKSSLTIRLCEGRFVSHHDVTIGVEFGSRIVPVGPPASLSYGINDPTGRVSAAPNTSKSSNTTAPSAPSQPSSSHKDARGKKGNAPNSSAARAAKPEDRQKHMKLSLWDTAGQETYKSITRSYFRGASGALLVFDITRRSTFDSVTAWLHDLRQIADDDIVVVLVGNKSDLAPASILDDDDNNEGVPNGSNAKHAINQRQVSRAEAEEWCRVNKVMQYIETSAKSGENVERAFLEVAERIHQNIEAGKYDLNDKRSGVKGPAAGAGNQRTVTLKATDKGGGKKSSLCC